MRAVVGLGGNLGDVPARFAAACRGLAALPGTRVVRRASLFRSRPHGDPDQPWFWNSAVLVETALDARALLDGLLAVEARLGRRRPPGRARWAPRPIDLDLLAHEAGAVHDPPALVVPHPRLAERRFALAPFVQLWPDWRHPALGLSARELLARCPDPEDGLVPLGAW